MSPSRRSEAVAPSDPVRRTMTLSVWEGALTQVFSNWTSGAVLTGYLHFLGATPMQFALAASVPFLAQGMAPLGSWLVGISGRPRALTTLFAALGRLVWLVPALIPMLSTGGGEAVNVVILLVLFSHLAQSCAGSVWTAWMGGLVPPEVRGSYFGTRNAIMTFVGMVANIGAGLFLDAIGAPMGFLMLYTGAVCLVIVGLALFQYHAEPERIGEALPLRQVLRVPLRDANFRRFLRFAMWWQFSVLLGATFVFPYFMYHLRLSFTEVAIYQAIAASTTIVCGPLWGKLADRVGNKAILTISTLLAGGVLPLIWILAVPGDPRMIYFSGIIDGLAWSAITPGIFNLSLATAPRQHRAAYVGVLSLCSGLAGFAGGLASGPLLSLFEGLRFPITEGYEWSGYHWLFVVTLLMRSQAWRFLAPVHEASAWRTLEVVRAMLSWRRSGFDWR